MLSSANNITSKLDGDVDVFVLSYVAGQHTYEFNSKHFDLDAGPMCTPEEHMLATHLDCESLTT